MLLEYWDQGGSEIEWFAQTCPEVGDHNVRQPRRGRRSQGMPHSWRGNGLSLGAEPTVRSSPRRGHDQAEGHAGRDRRPRSAGHRVGEKNLDLDYYMCSYYNPIPRDKNPEHVSGFQECYLETDRQAMTALIRTLSKPAIHYKVMAAGRNDPAKPSASSPAPCGPTTRRAWAFTRMTSPT